MAPYEGRIIDVDVHHCTSTDAKLVEYLPERWREFVKAGPRGMPLRPVGRSGGFMGNGGRRRDTFPAVGGRPGSDYSTLREQHLERYGIYKAVLTHDLGEHGSHPNQYFATALCAALNDWNIDTWLTYDQRFSSVVAINSQSPVDAAKEIRRVGSHPGLVGILLAGNPLLRAFGDPIYHPIYDAAAELGLCIVIHPWPNDPKPSVSAAGGVYSQGMSSLSQVAQQAMHYISSFIVHGVFEKWPTLHVQMTEYGLGWIPYLIWRLDENAELLAMESPWVKRRPSEYIAEHVRFSTQPIEESPNRKWFIQLLETVEGIDDLIMFSSDYPHATGDDAGFIARRLPVAWHHKVFYENAMRLYNWPAPVPIAAGVV